MRRFLKAWEDRGYEAKWEARIVNYADDFVILCRHTARQALSEARGILSRIGLTLNEQKTRTCQAWQEPFDFLGYTFGVMPSRNGKPYLAARPSKKSIARLKEKIRELTGPATLWQEPEELVSRLNALLRGWSHYFDYGTISRAYKVIHQHVFTRVRRWWGRKYQKRGHRTNTVPTATLYDAMGLLSAGRLLDLARGPR